MFAHWLLDDWICYDHGELWREPCCVVAGVDFKKFAMKKHIMKKNCLNHHLQRQISGTWKWMKLKTAVAFFPNQTPFILLGLGSFALELLRCDTNPFPNSTSVSKAITTSRERSVPFGRSIRRSLCPSHGWKLMAKMQPWLAREKVGTLIDHDWSI